MRQNHAYVLLVAIVAIVAVFVMVYEDETPPLSTSDYTLPGPEKDIIGQAIRARTKVAETQAGPESVFSRHGDFTTKKQVKALFS